MQERRQKQQLWAVITMTEAGVNDMLQVGWRYTQQQQQQQQQRKVVTSSMEGNDISSGAERLGHPSTAIPDVDDADDDDDDANDDETGVPQLYLQVYDKGRLGYNDENSMLQGGIEQLNHFGGIDATITTTTTTTEEPPPHSSTAPTTSSPPL
jgi:hypothetical protein